MATVYYQKDEPKTDWGGIAQGIGSALNSIVTGINYRKDNEEAAEVMKQISQTKSRQEAMQVIGRVSPRLLRNEKMYAKIQSYLEAYQPGEQALQVFDRTTGKIKLMPYKNGTVPTDEDFEAYNARLDPFEEFYAKVANPDAAKDPTQLPYVIEPLGKLGSREEAMKRAFDTMGSDELSNVTILNEKERSSEAEDLKTAIDLAVKNRQATIQQQRNAIMHERNNVSGAALAYAKSKGKTNLGKLQEDYLGGNINKAQYQAAVKKELSNRTFTNAMDKVIMERSDELTTKRMGIEKLITTGNLLIDNLSQGGPQIGTVGSLVRGYDSAISQVREAYSLLGWKAKAIDDYKWPTGLATASATTKNLVLTLTMARLAAEGQKGRDISDRDFERFTLTENGSPGQLIESIKGIIKSQQANYYSDQKVLAQRYGIPEETDMNAPFSSFGNKKEREAAERIRRRERAFMLDSGGFDNITIESKVREAMGDIPGLFDEEEE